MLVTRHVFTDEELLVGLDDTIEQLNGDGYAAARDVARCFGLGDSQSATARVAQTLIRLRSRALVVDEPDLPRAARWTVSAAGDDLLYELQRQDAA